VKAIVLLRKSSQHGHQIQVDNSGRVSSGVSLVVRLFTLVIGVLLGGSIWASSALAHASVSSTSPEAGSTLSESPKEVTITFDQGISVPSGGVRILNERAERLAIKKPRVGSHASGANTAKGANGTNTVSVGIPALRNGAYVVSWRAISEDGHPIRGAFTFRVGSNSDQTAVAKLARELLTNGKTDPALSLTMAMVRALSFATMLVLLGGVAYLLFIRTQTQGNDARVSKLLTTATIVAGTVGLAGVATFGPYAAGYGFGGLGDGTLLDDTLSSAIGRAMLLRAVALVAVGILSVRILSHFGKPTDGREQSRAAVKLRAQKHAGARLEIFSSPTGPERALLVVLSLVILWLSTLIGHGTTGRWGALGAFATAVHVGAASMWIGLLVVVFAATSGAARKSEPEPSSAKQTFKPATELTTEMVLHSTERFSAIAFWSVAALAVTGVLNGVRQIGSLRGLTTTNYGRLLLIKLGLVVTLLGLGWLSRKSLAQRRLAIAERIQRIEQVEQVDRRPVDPSASPNQLSNDPLPVSPFASKGLPPALVAIRRRMGIESLLSVGVIAITALLVNTPPPIEVLGKPVSVTMHGAKFLLDTTISPAQAGSNRVHFYALSPDGQTQAVEAMTVTASLPASDIAPIDLKVVRAGPNHFQALRADLPVKGSWRITVEVQLDTFTAESVAATVIIR
jgi:copper transport protein